MSEQPEVGTIGWVDLTVDSADDIRDFYRDVVGFKTIAVDMDGYNDYTMVGPDSMNPVCGVCHKRGSNQGLPSHWMVYFIVADVDASARLTTERGGKLIVPPKTMGGHGRYCVVEDPAGAVAALFEPA